MSTPEIPHATLQDWAKAAAKSAPAGDLNALNWVTPDGIPMITLERRPSRASPDV